ncbi:MAG TPA: potassium channel family protein [Solirubrobacter sp.]|nr:potassium channel family protein [Solirubrobacter sp.]
MLRARRAAFIIATATVVVAVLGGVLMQVFDEHEFGSAGSGLWFALQTVTTVGYGDHVPRSTGGRAVAAIVMVTGIAFVSVITAAISAAFVESARRRRGRSADDLILERLDELERKLDELRR